MQHVQLIRVKLLRQFEGLIAYVSMLQGTQEIIARAREHKVELSEQYIANGMALLGIEASSTETRRVANKLRTQVDRKVNERPEVQRAK